MVDIVADIGNSRIKWGRVAEGKIAASASLPADDRAAWDRQLAEWQLTSPLRWVLAAVRPPALDDLLVWLQSRDGTARVLARASELPLAVKVPEPDKVGIDRLLAAVAANARRAADPRPGDGAVVVGVGTAITVDLIDAEGAFLGGAIMPGPRLMALALHHRTALLPLVLDIPPQPDAPAKDTRAAIALGIHSAMAGGINSLIATLGEQLAVKDPDIAHLTGLPDLRVYVTGGGAPLVLDRLSFKPCYCPNLVLEGICLTAGSAP
jgi:type III pantothenate kinase